MILDGCPGAAGMKNPTIKEKICPQCGSVIEIFSTDTEVACDNCGFIAYNDALSCVKWCKYAEKCVGPELYKKFHDESLDKFRESVVGSADAVGEAAE